MEPICPQGIRPHSGAEAGFSIFEVLIGATILAVALLGHTASIFSEHKMSEAERARSTALLATEQFLERMRSDDDWLGLYGRLNTLRDVSETGSLQSFSMKSWYDAESIFAVSEEARNDHATLKDGRLVFPPQVYYEDFVAPSSLHEFHVVVDVPAAVLSGDTSNTPVLREDISLPNFGMPADLNGDGAIDDGSHNDDYLAIPIRVSIRFSHSDGKFEELTFGSWLWGYR